MHPIIREFITTDNQLISILEKHQDKGNFLEVVFLKILQLKNIRNTEAQIYEEIDQAISIGHQDKRVYFLFLTNAIGFISFRAQFNRALVIQSIAEAISFENIGPIELAYFKLTKAILKFHQGIIDEGNILFKEAMANVDRKHPRYLTFLINSVSINSYQGRLKDLTKEDLVLIDSVTNVNLLFPIIMMILDNFIFTGNFEEGFKYVKKFNENKNTDAKKEYKENIESKFYSLKILSGDFDEKNYPIPIFKYIANLFKALNNGNIEIASKYYTLCQSKVNLINLANLHFERYIPLHIELIAKNIGKSRLLFQEMGKTGHDYFSDFFLARIQLLEKNKAGALESFRRLYVNILQFDAKNRLLFELQFAKEMNPADIFLLTNGLYEKELKKTNSFIEKEYAPVKPLQNGIGLLVGESSAIVHVKKLIKKFAKIKEPILITGETGTGKELVARAIHEEGLFSKEPFLAINCGSLTETLLESELFGYEAGAFTGAQKEHQGIFEAARKGTVFLDEFGELSPKMQVSLLRVLESNEIRMIGGNKSHQITCKVVIATNIDLQKAVEEKRFREDLYFRITRFDIKLPPLRERTQDLPLIINSFLFNLRDSDRKPKKISAKLFEVFNSYRWPGNIRELKNEIERLVILHSEKEILDVEDFDFSRLQGEVPQDLLKKSNQLKIANQPKSNSFNYKKELDKSKILSIVNRGSKIQQRHEFIKALFHEYKRLTKSQVIEIASVSPVTALTDLKYLCEIGFIERVSPTKSVKSHYFALVE